MDSGISEAFGRGEGALIRAQLTQAFLELHRGSRVASVMVEVQTPEERSLYELTWLPSSSCAIATRCLNSDLRDLTGHLHSSRPARPRLGSLIGWMPPDVAALHFRSEDGRGNIRLVTRSLPLFGILILAFTGYACASEPAPLSFVADVPLTGRAVRFDYQSLDEANNRLYLAHMNADELVVFDTKKRSVIATVSGFPGVHGVIAVPELGRVYASATGEHRVVVVDAKTLKIIARVGPVQYPDGLAYAPDVKRVFVSDEHGDADAIVDTTTNALVKTIPLGGNAGNTVYDPGSGKILVAVSGKNQLAMIDPVSETITGRYSLPGIEGAHGVVLDVSARLAFVAGQDNHKLAVVDLSTMRVLGTYAVGRDPDVLAFDPGMKVIYVAAESGEVAVFQENGKSLVSRGQIKMPHAHTVSVDPQTHLVYFPLENLKGHPVLRIMMPVR